ncbi:MAG: hypothetical protein EFT35_07425 [Methanophagales archaeon ANME-1-THS]|nr:MAG: hypothetical protein EFT35_07425 [Methanophagales archaeon ANME-1-THS]
MQKHQLLAGLLALSVLCIVLTSGCVQEKGATPTPPPSAPPTLSTSVAGGLKTCTELNGYVCEVGDECPGEWLDASDTFSCCSKPCTSSIREAGVLTIEPFEPNPENEELGDVT